MTKYLLRGAALFLLATLTFAFDGNFQWQRPTAYTDGAPLLDQDIDFYSLYCNGTHMGDIENIGMTESWQAPVGFFAPGTYECHLTVTDINGQESEASNSVNFTVGPRVPNPPTGLVITLP